MKAWCVDGTGAVYATSASRPMSQLHGLRRHAADGAGFIAERARDQLHRHAVPPSRGCTTGIPEAGNSW